MATIAATMTSTPRGSHESPRRSRNKSSGAPPSSSVGRSRGVARIGSNESLETMKVFLEESAGDRKPRYRNGNLDSSTSLNRSNSNSSLNNSALEGTQTGTTSNNFISNRRRLAMAAAADLRTNQMLGDSLSSGSIGLNDSAGSLMSSNSGGGGNGGGSEEASSRPPRRSGTRGRVIRAGEKIRHRGHSSSDDGFDFSEGEEDLVNEDNETYSSSKAHHRQRSSSMSNNPSRNRSTGSRQRRGSVSSGQATRSRSKSRSHSQPRRSKSGKATNRRPLPPSSSKSNSSSMGSSIRRPRSSSRDSHDEELLDDGDPNHPIDDFIPPMSPIGDRRGAGTVPSAGGGAGGAGGKISYQPFDEREQELLDFLVSPASTRVPIISQRLGRSVDHIDFNLLDSHSGRATRSIGGSRSARRERTMAGDGVRSRTSITRETLNAIPLAAAAVSNSASSSANVRRPPRTSRGVARSKSDMDTFLSPLKKASRSSNGTNRPIDETSPEGTGTNDSPDRVVPPRSHSDGPGRKKTDSATRKKSEEGGGGGGKDLGDFFARSSNASQAISRRTRKPISGNRSVVSMPSRTRCARVKKSAEAEDAKPTSSRTTIGATSDDSDQEEEIDHDFDDSLDGSTEEYLNDTVPRAPTSGRSLLDSGDGLYGTPSDLEAALQMHMSRTENLLFDVFPKHVAEALRSGRKVAPENHECVTIFFSDIVGFTTISSELDPMKVSDMLDRLYNSFDALSHYHDVFKVETIGDAYMAVTNLTKNQRDHCKRIAEFAIDAVRVANQTLVDKDDPHRGFVNIRVGFHSGPVVSNVVGSRNPRFCLFGDTVNTASRMESNSEINRIHCSQTSAELLREQHPALKLNPRGSIEVKGKGEMHTYWVNEDAAMVTQREGTSRSIFKMLKGTSKTSKKN